MTPRPMRIKTGIYHFPWYSEQRWREAPFKYTPLLGPYDSSDRAVIAWQLDLIRYCGIDYVIFVLVPEDDWSFPTVGRAIDVALDYLRGTDMQWSFLLDPKSGPASAAPHGGSELAKLTGMYRCVVERGWIDGLVRGPSGKPLLFAFAPSHDDALALADEIGGQHECRMSIFLPESYWQARVDVRKAIPPQYFERVAQRLAGHDLRRAPLVALLVALGYVSFWGESVRNCAGIASVIPGYDDSLLHRVPQLAPQVSRREGGTLREQFQAAVRTRPEHITIYGWNEYYEGVSIEPSREFGMTYVELLRSLIAELHRVPEGDSPLAPACPIPGHRWHSWRFARMLRRGWRRLHSTPLAVAGSQRPPGGAT